MKEKTFVGERESGQMLSSMFTLNSTVREEESEREVYNPRWQIESLVTNVPRHLQVEVAFGLTSRPTVHSAVEKYNCSQCNKSFSQAGNLKRHSLIHTGEKPHQCAQCNCSANQAVNPREHIKNHRGEKLKKCKQCDYTTTRSNSLKHHKRDPL